MPDGGGKKRPLILASGSAGRAAVLSAAGIDFIRQPADIDERALEAEFTRENGQADPGAVALMLAEAKAKHVSLAAPDALVIGADQVMECGGVLYQKPPTQAAAREQLLDLRGRTHTLNAGICVARGGTVEWRHLGRASLTMRDFSEAFVDAYCQAEGDALTQSVGAYRIEGLGIQLFSAIEGDHFTIIGLPLIPLLGYLRDDGWLTG